MTNLQKAIERLYEIFSAYPGNRAMQGSSLYEQIDQWNADLFSKPLRGLTADELSLFTGKAMTTWGDVNDFKHFLPRILELTAQMDAPYEVAIVYHKLEYGKWLDWYAEEIAALEEFNRALWLSVLNDSSEKVEFDEFFYALFNSDQHPLKMLKIWDLQDSTAADIHLSKFIYSEQHILFGKSIDPNEHRMLLLKGWLLDEKKLERLQNAFFRCENVPVAEVVSWSEKILEMAINESKQEIE